MTTIIEADNPSHELVLPRDAVAAEIDRRIARATRPAPFLGAWESGVRRLLVSAFAASDLADEFDAVGQLAVPGRQVGRRTYGGSPSSPVTWLRQLRSEMNELPPVPKRRQYWTARRGQATLTFDLQAVSERFCALVHRLDSDHSLWARTFGVDCPDGYLDPSLAPRKQLEDLLGRPIEVTWPLSQRDAAGWGEDDLYDLVEALHDLATWPGTWHQHDYGGCIGHPGDFSPLLGQAIYRHEVNTLLARSDLGMRVADEGEDRGFVVRHDDAAEVLTHEALRHAPAGHQDEVAHAVALMRQRSRNEVAMRSAVVALARVLEAHRSLLKENLTRKDEGALFHIANEFSVRHDKADQKGDYDPVFLEWIFHWYLGTVVLIGKLVDRSAKDLGEPQQAVSSDEEPF